MVRPAVLWRRFVLVVLVVVALCLALELGGSRRVEAAPLGRGGSPSELAAAETDRVAARAASTSTSTEDGDWFRFVALGAAFVAAGVALGLVASSAARLRRMQWS